MRLVFGIVLVIGVALAGVAVHMTKSYVEQQKTALAQERDANGPAIKTTPVFVVKKRLKYGDELTVDDLGVVQWPEGAIPDGTFASVEDLFPKDRPASRYVTRTMEKFEPVLKVKLTEPGQRIGLRTLLNSGESAFTIKVDVSSGVSGFLRPGDRVDVYWTGKMQGSRDERQRTVSKLIESGVRIIAIDQSSNEEVTKASIARTVTVAVAPEQVAELNLAQSTGRLALSLVGQRDETIAEGIEIDQKQLLGIEEAQPVAQQAAPKVCTIRTRKGAEVVNIPIPCTN